MEAPGKGAEKGTKRAYRESRRKFEKGPAQMTYSRSEERVSPSRDNGASGVCERASEKFVLRGAL